MPDWTRGQLADEVRNHGFHFLDVDSPRRVNDLIQRAVEEINGEEPWSFNFVEQSVVLPATIADRGEMDHVAYGGRPLYPAEYGDVRDSLSVAGMPRMYYFAGDEMRIEPTTEEPVDVAYYSTHYWWGSSDDPEERQAEALNDSAMPTIPARFRDVIVILAVTYAQADSEDYDEDAAMRGKYEQRLEQMHRELIRPITDEAKRMRLVSGVDWA